MLVTGFGPFDNFSINPTEQLVVYLDKKHSDVESMVLPVSYEKARNLILGRLSEKSYDSVLSFGLNPFIGHFNLEEIAINIRASEVPDVEGVKIEDEMIREGGALGLRTRLPTSTIRDDLRKAGIPAKRSFSAGVYICNEVFYTLLDELDMKVKAGFIHVPQSTENISKEPRAYRSPHMSMNMIKRGAEIILDSIR